MTAPPRAPLLLFAWGNPSRGDDALGPELAARVERAYAAAVSSGRLEVLTDFQLQVEHVLDLERRRRVFFVDARTSGDGPWSLERVVPARDPSFSTHAMSPAALLHAFASAGRGPPPECWLLTIRGYAFALGEPLSPRARANLEAALGALPLVP